jgi:hypothetical protein
MLTRWNFIGDGENVPIVSDLKITFAWFRDLRLPRLDLHRLDFLVDLIEPLLKFLGFQLNADVAALADDMRLAGLLEFPHQDRVFEAALRARDVYRFVFKHFQTSQRSYKKVTTPNFLD